jgi:hypothetical protein
MKRALPICAFLVLAAVQGMAAEPPWGEGHGATLRMEELEVLGSREKPGVLYLPVHQGIRPSAPVAYDLFLEDMTRPVYPGDRAMRTGPTGPLAGDRSTP